MQTSEQAVLRDIVLVGGGHSHVGVLKHFGMHPTPGVRITLVCTDAHTPYSGMLPGYVAGHYGYDDVHIDLSRLCVFAGARFVQAEVIGLDRAKRKVLLRGRPALGYDVVSINIGSTPQVQRVPGAAGAVVPVKPITQFNQRWLGLLARVQQHQGTTTIAVVGGGAGGVELLLAMQYRLRHELQMQKRNPDALVFHLFTSDALLPTHNAGVQKRFERVLQARGVQVHCHARIAEVADKRLRTAQGAWVAADEIMWVTQAGGAQWLQDTGLALDDSGFIRVNDCLQSVTDTLVFVAGDVASMERYPLEKAGVFAVRMGMPLAENLRRAVAGAALKPYRPQTRWLALITTGDRYAVGSRGALGFAGRWVWRWKDHIDRQFMRRFGTFTPRSMTVPVSAAAPSLALSSEESLQAISALAMRCGGCGAKVGASVLSNALGALQPLERDDVLIGLHAPDDAAVVRVPAGKAMVHTVDFFRAFIDDPYVFGRIAANHALGDIFAMGADAQTATAIATVPPGLDSKVEELLTHMMAGAVEVLNAAGCALVGGHTGEGNELALGFAVNGLVDVDAQGALQGVMRKGGMHAGDVLILTKPLGTGTLFAAHARMAARGRWIQAALQSMQQSSQLAAQTLRAHGATACTDVTGFGLLGHLVEMTRPSGLDAQISLLSLPLLEGALECVQQGIVSSLQNANVRLRRALRNQAEFAADPRYPLLFDPQTAGGLLASVPADQGQACLRSLHSQGYVHAVVIGQVLAQGDALSPVVLTP
jgi:selenide,water dikinase